MPSSLPHVGHASHLELRGGAEAERGDGRRVAEEGPAVCVPRDLIRAVEVEAQQHGVERRAAAALADVRDERLQPGRHRQERRELGAAAVERGPARRLALVLEAVALVLDAVPADLPHDGLPPALGSVAREPAPVVIDVQAKPIVVDRGAVVVLGRPDHGGHSLLARLRLRLRLRLAACQPVLRPQLSLGTGSLTWGSGGPLFHPAAALSGRCLSAGAAGVRNRVAGGQAAHVVEELSCTALANPSAHPWGAGSWRDARSPNFTKGHRKQEDVTRRRNNYAPQPSSATNGQTRLM